jgi:hypothetical protein
MYKEIPVEITAIAIALHFQRNGGFRLVLIDLSIDNWDI